MQYFEFRKKTGKEKVKEIKFGVKISSESLQDRPLGITFFRFDCRIDLTQEETRIKRDLFCFHLKKNRRRKS